MGGVSDLPEGPELPLLLGEQRHPSPSPGLVSERSSRVDFPHNPLIMRSPHPPSEEATWGAVTGAAPMHPSQGVSMEPST